MASVLNDNATQLLAAVRDRYLTSGDFNGFYLSGGRTDPAAVGAAVELLDRGLVQVVGEADYMNIHIRPWPSRRTVDSQRDELLSLSPEMYGVCLYPTAAGMKGVRLPKRFKDSPYSQEMARGRSTLELTYFSVDVLEPYRNDPRFHFDFHDFGVNMGISDDAYLDEDEPEKDKFGLSHIGFAYDLSSFDPDRPDSSIIRRVAAFYGDLAEITPEHQQRWKTYEVPRDGLRPHPVWWGTQMGRWPDGFGPFDRFFYELANINELFERVWGKPLFAAVKRPSEFGWLLRPSQREWDEFIVQLDKLLSENLSHVAFDAASVLRRDGSGANMGTLSRFESFMRVNRVAPDRVKEVLRPLRAVRSARQKPAHALRKNVTDKTFIHKQVDLLHDLNDSLIAIRYWLATHPKNRDSWKPQFDDDIEKDYRF
jgi:hypothetical protein